MSYGMTSRHSKRNALSMKNDNSFGPPLKKNRRSKRSSEDKIKEPQNIFIRLISNAGIIFDIKGNKIETDPTAFAKKLDCIIVGRNDDIQETKDSLATALEERIEDEQFLVSCLMPTELSMSFDDLEISSSQLPSSIQDSVMKLLMRSAHMQSIVITALIKKLPLYAENETVKVDQCFGIGENCGADIVNMPRLILNQLRWLDIVFDSADIASQLLEISSVMCSEIACDIIALVPDMLSDDGDHEVVALKLCDLLSDGPERITAAVFDALSNLYLTEVVKKKVYDLALSYLSTASVQDIPVIIKYLLRSCDSVDSVKQVIEILHPHLDFNVLISSASDDDLEATKSSTSLLADIIFSSMQFQNFIGTAWLSILEKTHSSHFNVGDIIALLLLCDVNNSAQRKNAINLLHTKIKRGLLTGSILVKTVKVCSHIISSRFQSIRHLVQSMLWHSDKSLKHAAALLYEQFLLHLDNFSKQECVGLLVEHISSLTSGKESETSMALDVLSSVAKSNASVLVPYANFLRDALDHMDAMSLGQVRKSYKILSCLAFTASDALTLGMRDDLHMILQKQLTHISDRYKHVGIIGSVAVLVAMSKTPTVDSNTKKINSIFELLSYVLRNDVKGWALFFDEIFIILQTNPDLSEGFLKRLNDEAQGKLQEKFLTDYDGSECSSSKSQDVSLCYRFGLLSADEQKETDLGVTLTPLLISSQNRYVTTLLCSLFRALSSIERKLSGTLGEIDALLCCPVFLHDVVYDSKTKFAELSAELQILILDSLFAILNWFRELVSVFCVESDPEVRLNVLVRLKQICDLQTSIDKLLPIGPDSYIPIAVNSSNVDLSLKRNATNKVAPKASSKPEASSSTQHSKLMNQSTSSLKSLKKIVKTKKEKKCSNAESLTLLCNTYRPFLRELSIEVFGFLKYPLQCVSHGHRKLEKDETDEQFLRPRHLQLLLYDLNEKLKHRLGSVKLPIGFGNQAGSGIGFEQLDQLPTLDIVKMAVKLTPRFCKHLEDINSYFDDHNTKDQSKENLDDSSMSIDAALEIAQHERLASCFESLVEMLHHVLSWHGLDEDGNQKLLEALMRSFSSRLGNHSDKLTLLTMLSNAYRYFRKFSPAIPTSTAGFTLLKVLVVLHDFADGHKSQQSWMARQLSETAHDFLKRDWTDLATLGTNQKRNSIITGLFLTHLKYSEDILLSIEHFLKNSLSYLLDDPVGREDDESVTNYPCLTKANFYLFYRTMIEMLGTQASAIPSPSKSSANDVDNVDLLLQWNEVVKVLDMLIRLLKTFPSRVMLGPALKYARSIVESFNRTGIPVCEVTFRAHQDDVVGLLKKVQISTRQLQHAACHSKVSKDSTLTNHVPALKRCLETFVFRVKALLVLHSCQDAFWLGNLKNRNLQGEELLSQLPPSSPVSNDDVGGFESNAGDISEQSYSESY